ncbi:MAG: tetratricopeptide repeat protein [Thaumarchaeota archaeon]|nr:tetratricopeptide repeat protein [Nitrososphaerota archaeon]
METGVAPALMLLAALLAAALPWASAQGQGDGGVEALAEELRQLREAVEESSRADRDLFLVSFWVGMGIAAAAVVGTVCNALLLRRHVNVIKKDMDKRLRPVLVWAEIEGDGPVGVYGDGGLPGGIRIKLVNAGQVSAEEIVVHHGIRLVGEGEALRLQTRRLGALEPGKHAEVRIPMSMEGLGRALGGGMVYVDAVFEYRGGGHDSLAYHVAGYRSGTLSTLFAVDDVGVPPYGVSPGDVGSVAPQEAQGVDAKARAGAKSMLEESEAAISADPGSATARRERAAALRALGQHEEALREIDLAEEACRVDARVLRERARILEGLGRPDEAIGALRRIRERGNDDLCVHRELARLHALLGEYDDAYGAWVAIAGQDPSYETYMSMASTLMTPRRYDAAVVAFGKAIDARLGDAYAHVQKGIALTNCGRYTEAAAALRRAAAHDPGMADAHAGLAYALYRLGREAEASEELRLAVEAEPDNQRAHIGRGVIALEMGLPEEAEEAFAEARRLDPSMRVPQARMGMGSGMHGRGGAGR